MDSHSAQRIVVPFAGSSKYIAAFAKVGRTIWSWDTQEATNVIVRTLGSPFKAFLERPYGLDGYAKEDFPFQGIDRDSARLLNYIAKRGTTHERCALVKCMFRCTAMGRLTQWAYKVEDYHQLWDIFMRARDSLRIWSGMPGELVHRKGDFFEASPPVECDLLYIDPPKVVGRTDVYSGRAFRNLNSVLEQREPPQPVWVQETYIERITTVLRCTKWRHAILFHSSGLVPTIEKLVDSLPFKPHEVKQFEHGDRLDYAIVYGGSDVTSSSS